MLLNMDIKMLKATSKRREIQSSRLQTSRGRKRNTAKFIGSFNQRQRKGKEKTQSMRIGDSKKEGVNNVSFQQGAQLNSL